MKGIDKVGSKLLRVILRRMKALGMDFFCGVRESGPKGREMRLMPNETGVMNLVMTTYQQNFFYSTPHGSP